MFCSHCGCEIQPKSIFCSNCGTKIAQTTQTEEARQICNPQDLSKFNNTKILAECATTMYDYDCSGSIGIAKAEGKLILYQERFEFRALLGGALSRCFGIAGLISGAKKAKNNSSMEIPYNEIKECTISSNALGQPAIVLKLCSGVTISYVNGFYQKAKFQNIYQIFTQQIQNSQMASDFSQAYDTNYASDSASCESTFKTADKKSQETNTVKSCDVPESNTFPYIEPAKKDCVFVMKVKNVFVITGQGIAVNGMIETGKAIVGNKMIIADSEKQIKSEHMISKIAVGSELTEVTPDIGQNVSFLFSDCKKEDISVGDYILKESEN